MKREKKVQEIHEINKKTSTILVLLSGVFLIFLDQLSKMLAVAFLKGEAAVELIPRVFELCYLENKGAAFGLLQGGRLFFIILTMIILLIFICFYIKIPFSSRFTPLRITYVVFSAGAIGNFIDRIINGYVIDFFYFKLIHFPVFNIADIYVTCSCIVFFVLLIFKYKDPDFELLFPTKKKKV
ncbi:MAG: signal peptidase II [Lachnospiraceae bacterium]